MSSGELKLYTFMMDHEHTNLMDIKPFKIIAYSDNTIKQVKEQIESQLNIPACNQIVFFNNSVQLDACSFLHCCVHEAETFIDGKQLFIYLTNTEEKDKVEYIANKIGEMIVQRPNLKTEVLHLEVFIPAVESRPHKRVSVAAAADAPTQLAAAAPKLRGEGKWSCIDCTFINDDCNVNCVICGSSST